MLINNEEHNDLCVGIDLGTTNSVLATVNLKANGDIVSKVVDLPRAVDVYNSAAGKARLNTQKTPLLPSCVYYREEHGYEPLVGDFAKNQYALRPHLVAKSIKSQMGSAHAEGLADEIMDKTPAQVSARILQHMLREASKIYRTEIKDAVITVPANFDSVMCQATRDAAALAGIQVTNKDGSERPVLLSEPNAVIYDLINQVQNGEISNHIIDLSSEKNVLVFDLGGGTLDITMHKIKRREDCPDVLKVDEIATNRYTLLGGDDFDQAIANVMFEHYQKQYATYPEVVRKLQQEKKAIMPQLLNYAEELKLELSERQRADSDYAADDDFSWYDEKFDVGGNMGGIGYSYDDSFTQEDVEKILQPFMGQSLQFADYKKIDSLQDTKNIIYPILDVLQKSAAKLAGEVKVDAVIVNGGMSKFYMVINRLREFFGLEPIVALDPDQAVARGAAVYHYYLHKYAQQMQEDMRMVGADAPALQPLPGKAAAPKAAAAAVQQRAAIEWGKNILNDSLYLGMLNGAVRELIAGGTELPYQSDYIKGFQLLPDKAEIAIPIKRRTFGDTYQTIGNGHLKLKHGYKDGAYVAIRVLMGSNKVLSMEMLLSSDVDMQQILEQKTAEIIIGGGNLDASATKLKFNPPVGTKLDVHNELNNLKNLCERKYTAKGNAQKIYLNNINASTTYGSKEGLKADGDVSLKENSIVYGDQVSLKDGASVSYKADGKYVYNKGGRDTADAGTYDNSLKIDNAALTGDVDKLGNYELVNDATGSITVKQATLQVSLNDVVRTYGDTSFTEGTSYGIKDHDALVNGDEGTLSIKEGAITDVGLVDNNSKTNNKGEYKWNVGKDGIVADGVTNFAKNYDIKVTAGNSKVNAKKIYLNNINASTTYGSKESLKADGNVSLKENSIVYGDQVSLKDGASVSYKAGGKYAYNKGGRDTADAGTYDNSLKIDNTALTGDVDKLGNYELVNDATGSITVKQATLQVSLNDVVRTYGNATITSGGYSASGIEGLVNGDSYKAGDVNVTVTGDGALTGNTEGKVTNNAGDYTWNGTATTDNAGLGKNYNLVVTANGKSTVEKANLVVNLNDITRVYGNLDAKNYSNAFTFGNNAGLVNGDSGLVINADKDGAIAEGSVSDVKKTNNVGKYEWNGTASGVENLNTNYDVQINAGKSEVTKAKLTFVVDDKTITQGVPAKYTGKANGLTNGDTLAGIGVGGYELDSSVNPLIVGVYEDKIGVLINGSLHLTGGDGLLKNYKVEIDPGTLTVLASFNPADDYWFGTAPWDKERNLRERKAEFHYVAGGMSL